MDEVRYKMQVIFTEVLTKLVKDRAKICGQVSEDDRNGKDLPAKPKACNDTIHIGNDTVDNTGGDSDDIVDSGINSAEEPTHIDLGNRSGRGEEGESRRSSEGDGGEGTHV